jgi:GTP cyclohydrolase III
LVSLTINKLKLFTCVNESITTKEEVRVYVCVYVCMYPIDAQTAPRDLMKFAGIVYHVPRMDFVKFGVNPSTGIPPRAPKDTMLFQ